MAGMRESCGRCGKPTLGLARGPKGEALCKSGRDGRACYLEVEGAYLVDESDRKNETLGDRDRKLRNHGSVFVEAGKVSKVSKAGKVTTRKMTAADRKRFGLPEAKEAKA